LLVKGGFSLALKADGTVVAWGVNDFGQSTVPAGLSGVVSIAAGSSHSLALKSDGTVVAWGRNVEGQSTVPADLTGVLAIAAGGVDAGASQGGHSLALKSDGTVVAWGDNRAGQSTVPNGLNGVVAIAAGIANSLALKSDGTVVAWGSNGGTVPGGLKTVAIAAGADHNLALVAPATQPLRLGAPQWVANGYFRSTLFGETGWNYTLQSSTNLTLWTDLQTGTFSVSAIQITDTNVSSFPHRFYRVRTQ